LRGTLLVLPALREHDKFYSFEEAGSPGELNINCESPLLYPHL